MPDTPLAIRTTDETKALFNELAERSEFENKGDFLARLLIQYQAAVMKENTSVLKPAIEAVETLTGRLFDVLNGAGAIIATKEEKHKQELESQRSSFEETRSLVQQRVSFLEQELTEAAGRAAVLSVDKETAEGKIAGLNQQIKQMDGAIADKDALISEYKDKNDTLSGIASTYKAAADENKALSDVVNNSKHVNEGLQREIDELKREIQLQADAFKTEQANLRVSLSLQGETALLKLRKEYQARAEEQQAKYTAVIDAQQSKNAAAVREYEDKVRELLDSLERERASASLRAISLETATQNEHADK